MAPVDLGRVIGHIETQVSWYDARQDSLILEIGLRLESQGRDQRHLSTVRH